MDKSKFIIKAGTNVQVCGMTFKLENNTLVSGDKGFLGLADLDRVVSHKIQLTCDKCGE